jgi:hypothetical protein
MNILPHKDWNPWGSKQIAKASETSAPHHSQAKVLTGGRLKPTRQSIMQPVHCVRSESALFNHNNLHLFAASSACAFTDALQSQRSASVRLLLTTRGQYALVTGRWYLTYVFETAVWMT